MIVSSMSPNSELRKLYGDALPIASSALVNVSTSLLVSSSPTLNLIRSASTSHFAAYQKSASYTLTSLERLKTYPIQLSIMRQNHVRAG